MLPIRLLRQAICFLLLRATLSMKHSTMRVGARTLTAKTLAQAV